MSAPRCFPRLELAAPETDWRELIAPEDDRDARSILLQGLSDTHAESLGLLLPAMVCGEESASLVFHNESRRIDDQLMIQSQRALDRIAGEESVHEDLLRLLGEQVPRPAMDSKLRNRARVYFLRLKGDDIAKHFSRIAWLDSGVCTIFAQFVKPHSPLRASPGLQRMFRKILLEEAAHTAFSRRYVARMGVDARSDDESFHLVREGLVTLLEPCASGFDGLGIDPDTLFASLKRRDRGPSA